MRTLRGPLPCQAWFSLGYCWLKASYQRTRDTDGMGYREFGPPPALASHVACLWSRTGPAPRVLPDGCVDLVWTGAGLVVAGPATRAVVPEFAPDEPKLGVRFRVGAAGAALGLPAGELLDRHVPLGEVWTRGEEPVERVGEAPATRGRLGALVEAVAARVAQAPPPDRLARGAALELSRPRTRVGPLGERLGASERQLRRRFLSSVGYSPRTLARVLRLQRFLVLARRGGGLARLAAEAGYADQAHLTRECARLTGLTPAALLATGAEPAGERLTAA
jgi:AraC-like DNA-binding protein